MHYPVPQKITSFGEVFTRNGHQLFIVGGSIRDWLLGVKNHDYDFATDATPGEVTAMFKGHTIPTGIEHGTVTVRYWGDSYEVTTFRTEGAYLDSRHPSSVSFVRSLAQDLERRDFTINAFAVNVEDGQVIDQHGGFDDLKNKRIKAIGVPRERFQEDALRILRALRFASKLNFEIEGETFKAMAELRENLKNVSEERIHDELVKLVASAHPKKGLLLMDASRVMDVILPELAKGRDCMQNGMHHDTVLMHNINACQAAADHGYSLYVRLAALFHDLGKPDTVVYDPVSNTYYNHDKVGSKMSERILRRLKASNEEVETVSLLVDQHMFAYSPEWSDAAVRRFIKRVGLEHVDDLIRVRYADVEAMYGKLESSIPALDELKERVDKVVSEKQALSVKDLALNGNDVMHLGIPKGPRIGKSLNYLLECVLEDPSQNNKEQLTKLVLIYNDINR